jgi:hypothetical protein
MMAPSNINKASMPCLGASMRSPRDICLKVVQKKGKNQKRTKLKQKTHHLAKKKNKASLVILLVRRFATACGRVNKFS